MAENTAVPKITALAISYNEALNVERYIERLKFADEIIFVDSESTDNTQTLAAQMGAKVLTRPFTNFSEQRNFAIAQASHDWILFFDLDEIITPELEEEIKATVKNPGGKNAFFVKRTFHFLGNRIRFEVGKMTKPYVFSTKITVRTTGIWCTKRSKPMAK